MIGLLKRVLRRWLRIPDDPDPPEGSASSVRVFHAARGYFKLALVRWGFRQLGVVVGLIFALTVGAAYLEKFVGESAGVVAAFVDQLPRWVAGLAETLRVIERQPVPDTPGAVRVSLGPMLVWLEWLGLGLFLVQLPVSYALVRLDYELRFYIVTDRSLRIREGVGTVKESTMTFDNIQNLAIRQGPVQRLFGIADLRVRTAGGGDSDDTSASEEASRKTDSMHIGYFRGVDNAEELRDTILTRLKALKDDGIGEARENSPQADEDGVLAAARRVLEEARALRAGVAG